MKKILITGKTSRFVKFLKTEINELKPFYPSKKFNILNYNQISKFLKKRKLPI